MIDQVPQSREAEEAVVGGVLLDPELIATTSTLLTAEDFYWSHLRSVYQSVHGLLAAGVTPTLVAVHDGLKKHEADQGLTVEYLRQLCTDYAGQDEAHVETHCRIISDYSALRRTIEVCRIGIVEATSAANGRNPREIIDRIETLVLEVQTKAQREASSARASDIVFDLVEKISTYEPSSDGIQGISTGFNQFDDMTGGLQAGQLVIVAGRPSMGKTAFALNVAMNAALGGQPGDVAVFSLEMDTESLMERLLASEARVSPYQWRRGMMTPEEVKRMNVGASAISSCNLWIDDHPTQTVLDIRSKCRRLKASPNGLKLVLIDYLQLMRPVGVPGGNRSREQEVAQMSLALKGLARELEVPVICLSQLSRSPEARQDKRPMLSDLRESGSIEQDADLVAFLFRPEYYFRDDESLMGAAELIIAKQRNGPTGVVPLVWQKDYMRFDTVTPKIEERFSYQ